MPTTKKTMVALELTDRQLLMLKNMMTNLQNAAISVLAHNVHNADVAKTRAKRDDAEDILRQLPWEGSPTPAFAVLNAHEKGIALSALFCKLKTLKHMSGETEDVCKEEIDLVTKLGMRVDWETLNDEFLD